MKITLDNTEITMEMIKADMIPHTQAEKQVMMDEMYLNVFHMLRKLENHLTTKITFVVDQVNKHLDSEIDKANKEHRATASLEEIKNTLQTLKLEVK